MRMNARYLILFLLAVNVATGCDSSPEKAHAAIASSGEQAAIETSSMRPDPALAVALADPGGVTPEDEDIRAIQRRIEVQPELADLTIELGMAWVRKARRSQNPRLYQVAAALANKARAQGAPSSSADLLDALVAQNEHDFERVSRLAASITKNSPEDPAAWGLLGDALLELGHTEEAINAYQSMIDLRPGIPSYSRIAYVRWLHGDVDGSLQMWQLCVDVGSPRDPEPLAFCHTQAAHVLWLAGKNDAASIHYARALELVPAYAEAALGMGRVYFASARYEDALASFNTSFTSRKLEETFVWILHTHEAREDERATRDARETLREGSGFDDPRTLSLFYSTLGILPDRALALAKKDAEDRGDVYTQAALAMAYLGAKDLDRANEHALAALALGTPDPRLLGQAGLIALARGDAERALSLMTRSLELQPVADPGLKRRVERALASMKGAGQ